MANAIATQVQELYIGYLGRAAEQAGLNYWVNQITTGAATIESVALGFTQSNEYAAEYGNLSTAELVAKVYENVLGREGEAAGVQYWTNMIESGTITADALVNTILNNLGSIDQATVNNKVYVANVYTLAAGANYNVEQGADILVGINETSASVTAALAKIDIDAIVTPAALAEALTALQAANQAKADFLDDGDDATDLAAEEAAVTGARIAAEDDVESLVLGYVSGEYVAGAAANVNAAYISNAQAAAAKAVTDAQAEVTKIVGLNALINTYKNAAAAKTNADKAVAPAQLLEDSEVAKAEVLLGFEVDVDATTGAVTEVTGGDDTEVLTIVGGKLVVNPALTDAAKAAATALLPSVQANLDAKAAADKAQTNLVAAANAIETKEGSTPDNNTTLQTGKASALLAAQESAADLAEALADLAEAQAAADSLAELNAAIEAATEHLTDNLGVELVDLAAGFANGTGDNDVFLFTQGDTNISGSINDFGVAGQDYLFIGEGYTFNADIKAGNNSVLEVFFTQDGANVVVSIESSAFGSSAVTPELNNITLTGVNVADLSFDNGFITVAA